MNIGNNSYAHRASMWILTQGKIRTRGKVNQRHKLPGANSLVTVSKNPANQISAATAHAAMLYRSRIFDGGVPIMGMAVGGSKPGHVSDPNIVPLIDVLLVLIIIFMVITPQMPTGLPVRVLHPAPPQPKTELPDPQVIVVQVLQGGKLMKGS